MSINVYLIGRQHVEVVNGIASVTFCVFSASKEGLPMVFKTLQEANMCYPFYKDVGFLCEYDLETEKMREVDAASEFVPEWQVKYQIKQAVIAMGMLQ